VNDEILAHHALLLAIPACVPAVAVVGVVLWIAIRDRRSDANTSEREDNSE
jgi:hypothetical protein